MAAKFKIAILRKTGKALNEVLGLTPPIDVDKGTVAQITKGIKEALDLLQDDDVFAADVTEVLNFYLPDGMELQVASTPADDEEEGEDDEAEVDDVEEGGEDDEEDDGEDEADEEEGDEEPEETEPEEEPAPTTKKKPAAKKAADSAPKKLGVIATVVKLLHDASPEGLTFDDLWDDVCAAFPERNPEGMGKTIRIQISTRLRKEKGIPVVYDKDSKKYSITKK